MDSDFSIIRSTVLVIPDDHTELNTCQIGVRREDGKGASLIMHEVNIQTYLTRKFSHALESEALFRSTSNGPSGCVTVMAGTSSLYIPPFWNAISSSVSPNTNV